MALIRAQAISGLFFAVFLILHLANTMTASLGQSAYDDYLGTVRGIYQIPFIEIGLIGVAGAVHIGIAFKRGLARRRRNRGLIALEKKAPNEPAWLRLHRACGWFLVLVIIGHFLATRGPGLFLDTPVGFSYMTFSLTQWPAMMYPYYFLLFSAGVFHLLHGGVVALNVLELRVGAPTVAWTRVALILALAAGTTGILSLGSVIGGEVDTARFDEYRELYETYLPFMVTWN